MSMTTEMTVAEQNRAKVETLRIQLAKRGLKHLINGEPVDSLSGETFAALTPVDNTVICKVAAGDAADIDRAAQAAKAAFPAWRDTPAKERKRLLHRVADLIEANAEEITKHNQVRETNGQAIKFKVVHLDRATARVTGKE